MSKPDFDFKLTHDADVQVELDGKRISISCKTDKGKWVRLEGNVQTFEKLHDELRKQLDTV
jgi:hypothetical protein